MMKCAYQSTGLWGLTQLCSKFYNWPRLANHFIIFTKITIGQKCWIKFRAFDIEIKIPVQCVTIMAQATTQKVFWFVCSTQIPKKIPFFSVFNSKEVIEIFELASIPFEASLLPQNYNHCQSLYVGFLGAVASYR